MTKTKKEFEGIFSILNEWEIGPTIQIDNDPIYSYLWELEGKNVKITVEFIQKSKNEESV